MAIDLTRTIAEFHNEAFAKYPDRPAYSCLGQTLTYADIDRLSGQFASFLQNTLNMQPGDHLGIQLPNILQYPVVAIGALRAGLILVNANPLYTERELRHQLNDAKVEVLVCAKNLATVASTVAPDTQLRTVITTGMGDLHEGAARDAINQSTGANDTAYSFDHEIDLLDALEAGQAQPYEYMPRKLEDIAILQYTGGTTGLSKGAMLLHSNIACNWQQSVNLSAELSSPDGDTVAIPLPLYHIYALSYGILQGISTGSHNIFDPQPAGFKLHCRGI